MSFFTGFGVSSVVYLALNWVWPVPGSALRDGFFLDERDVSEFDGAEPGKDVEEGDVVSVKDMKDKKGYHVEEVQNTRA